MQNVSSRIPRFSPLLVDHTCAHVVVQQDPIAGLNTLPQDTELFLVLVIHTLA